MVTPSHPLFARVCARRSLALESKGVAEHRGQLLAGLTGRVLEVGAGNGLNFARYPASVTEVVAVEPEPYLLTLAAERASQSRFHASVVRATAENLPIGDGLFDAAVYSLTLCSVASPALALREVRRVLRPGGELRFYEHVAAPGTALHHLQRWMDPAWRRLVGGCRLTCDTESEISRQGFDIQRCEHFDFRPAPISLLNSPHILGAARRV
jgi:ubiquinone/menaquinone biosynthesis C-methylase UbiE